MSRLRASFREPMPAPSRRSVLGLGLASAAHGALGLLGAGCKRADEALSRGPMSATDPTLSSRQGRLPVVFVSHGSPMNAIEDNPWSRGWVALGQALPTPRAILCISAHWLVRGTHVTTNPQPKTIHDFGGFPRQLYEISYPAAGDEALARRIVELLKAVSATGRDDWGLDHGTWSVLVKTRPAADVPVLQLSLDRRASAAQHLAIGKALAPLREQGVLVLGSGNVTHNLAHALGSGGTETPLWAERFDRDLASAVEQRDEAFLLRALGTDDGRWSHPTPEHYWPLLYTVGAASPSDTISYPITGFDLGSLSMRTITWS